MSRMLSLLAGAGLILAVFTAPAEEDYLEGKWAFFVNLSQPGGGARLGVPTESAVVIGAKVTPPKQTREDWLEDLPTFYGKWKPFPLGEDKGTAGGGGSGFKLVALGGDLWGKSDKCFQLLTPVVGDFSITCQVTWERAGNDWAKAGLIFRDGTSADAAYVGAISSYKKEMRMHVRNKAGDDTWSPGGSQGGPAVVMRLERQGGTFRTAMTIDGRNWVNKAVGNKFSPAGHVGFVVAGNDAKSKAMANFAVISAKGQVTEEGNVVMFEKDEYSVVESGKVATLSVRRVGDGKGVVKVPWTAKSGTAQAGKDFVGETGEIVWNDGEASTKKFTIPVTNNAVEEKEKMFTVVLENPQGSASLGSKQARVTILDDDGPGSIRFQSVVTCVPDAKTPAALINVLREYGKKGAIEVRYSTRQGTAKSGDKYKDQTGALTWADGDDKPKTIKIPILWPELAVAGAEDLLVNGAGKKAETKKPADTKKADTKKGATEEE